MKKFASFVLALALCLSLAAPALAAERTIRAMTQEEALQYVDFGPNTPVEKPGDVLIEKEFHLDLGSLGSTTTKIGYYAIRKDAVFKLGNLGTPGGDSFLVMYLTPYVKGDDGAYHVSGQYYLRGGSQPGWALNDNPTRADEVRVTTGNNVAVGIPAEHLPEDTLYCFTIMAYLTREIICEDLFFKVDDAKVAEVIGNDSAQANSAPTSVEAFTDVAAASPFRAAIDWAVKEGITKGTSATTFGPSNTCTTSHILTFLYRVDGSPVNAGSEHAGMTWWAKEQGIDTSNLNAPCTRASAVTYIWKAAGSPKPSKTVSFSDVSSSADYAQAVSWAVQVGITNGTSSTTFSPNQVCTRGQIVTFLYRAISAVNASGTPGASGTPAAGTKEEQLAAQVVELVNQERAKEGLPPLQTLPAITAAAQVRVQELAIDRSHTRPNGKDGTTAMDDEGVMSTMSGENIAFGFNTAEEPMKWWMDSPIHRMNIMMPYYTHIGVAYLNGNWVQLFARLPESTSSAAG